MTMADLSNEELRALELLAQLAAISPEGETTTVRMTLRTGDGRLVGEALLSAKAVEALTDSVISLNAYQADMEEGLEGEPLLDVDESDVADLITEAEAFLNGGHL